VAIVAIDASDKRVNEDKSKFETCVEDGYVVTIDGREASDGEKRIIQNNISSYLIDFDDAGNVISVMTRTPNRVSPIVPVPVVGGW